MYYSESRPQYEVRPLNKQTWMEGSMAFEVLMNFLILPYICPLDALILGKTLYYPYMTCARKKASF